MRWHGLGLTRSRRRATTTTFPAARFRRRIELSLRGGGFDMNSVHRLLVTFGRRNYIESVPMSLFLAFDESEPNRDPQ